jgi:hypothetical protein
MPSPSIGPRVRTTLTRLVKPGEKLMRMELYLARTVASELMNRAERDQKDKQEHIIVCIVPVHPRNTTPSIFI